MRSWWFVVLAACGGGGGNEARPAPPRDVSTVPRPPVARRDATLETLHGVQVADPYRWLEGDDDEVKAWTAAQNAYAAHTLGALPQLPALRGELAKIYQADRVTWGDLVAAGPVLYARRRLPQTEQAALVTLADPAKPETAVVVFDPNRERGLAIDWFEPSRDGALVAVAVSRVGSEVSDLVILDRAGKELERIPNVNRPTAGGSAAWLPDGTGLYYTTYPSGGDEHASEPDNWQRLHFHRLGTQLATDQLQLIDKLGKVSAIRVSTNARGDALVAVQEGDSGPVRHFVHASGNGPWQLVADVSDEVAGSLLGTRGEVWLVSRKGAPNGRVLRLPVGGKLASAKVVIAETAQPIEALFWAPLGVVDAGDKLYVQYQAGGPVELRAFTRAGKSIAAPALPPVASVGVPIVWKDGLVVGAETFTSPWVFYGVDKAGAVTALPISAPAVADLAGYEAIRETATSRDGTAVPYTVVQKKGAARDGTQPCLATAYGGFGISMDPRFLERESPLLARGVCIIVGNIRGGGERGEAWHRAGALGQKQNGFDDFFAILGDVVTKKYTSVARLAAEGGSNGGLLMGALLTQHPELVRAVHIDVGVLDMLRYPLTPNGTSNIPEYGTPADPTQFAYLHAYSPLHHVTPNTAYPAVLLMAGENDGRVPAWNSRKMTAALQAAQSGPAPILLRTSATAGHGIGTGVSERAEKLAQAYAFVLWQLGVK